MIGTLEFRIIKQRDDLLGAFIRQQLNSYRPFLVPPADRLHEFDQTLIALSLVIGDGLAIPRNPALPVYIGFANFYKRNLLVQSYREFIRDPTVRSILARSIRIASSGSERNQRVRIPDPVSHCFRDRLVTLHSAAANHVIAERANDWEDHLFDPPIASFKMVADEDFHLLMPFRALPKV
jgi:hypothetical protein